MFNHAKNNMLRCQECLGWPITVGCESESIKCGYCDEDVEEEIIEKYYKLKNEFIESSDDSAEALLKLLTSMFSIFHPYDLCFIAACQITLLKCLEADMTKQSLKLASGLYNVLAQLVPDSNCRADLKMIIKYLKEISNI